MPSNDDTGKYEISADTGNFVTSFHFYYNNVYEAVASKSSTTLNAYGLTDTINFAVHKLPYVRDYAVIA